MEVNLALNMSVFFFHVK